MKLRGNKSNLENVGIEYIPPNNSTRKNHGRYLYLKQINSVSPELQYHEPTETLDCNGDNKNVTNYKSNDSDINVSQQQSLFSEGFDTDNTGDTKKLVFMDGWTDVTKDELPDGW